MVHSSETNLVPSKDMLSFLNQLDTDKISGFENAFEGFFCSVNEYFGDRAKAVKLQIATAAIKSIDD